MLARLRSRAQEEKGFTLIELLVVVLIIGILAAIAIPAFLSQKKGAQDSAAKSLLRNSAIALEAYYTENESFANAAGTAALASGDLDAIEPNIDWTVGALPTGTSGAPLAKDDQVNVTITGGTAPAPAYSGYTLTTRSTSGAGFVWDRDYTGATGKCKVATGTVSGACAIGTKDF